MEKMAWGVPKWGQEDFVFPTNPDLTDILGRTYLNFEKRDFCHFLDPKVLDFQVPRFPRFGLGKAGLGPWAELLHIWGPLVLLLLHTVYRQPRYWNWYWGARHHPVSMQSCVSSYGFTQRMSVRSRQIPDMYSWRTDAWSRHTDKKHKMEGSGCFFRQNNALLAKQIIQL